MTAFKLIADVFEKHDDDVLEIEVLGSGVPLPEGQLILEDDLCFGIPKKVLAKAFIEAREVFHRRDIQSFDESVSHESFRSAHLALKLQYFQARFSYVSMLSSNAWCLGRTLCD